MPSYSGNLNNQNCASFCKNQHIKYKPWVDSVNIVYGSVAHALVKAMSVNVEFLKSVISKKLIQNWDRELQNVELFLNFNYENNDKFSTQPFRHCKIRRNASCYLDIEMRICNEQVNLFPFMAGTAEKGNKGFQRRLPIFTVLT